MLEESLCPLAHFAIQYIRKSPNCASSPVNTAFVRAMYKMGLRTINKEKTREIGTLCPHRNFSQAIKGYIVAAMLEDNLMSSSPFCHTIYTKVSQLRL